MIRKIFVIDDSPIARRMLKSHLAKDRGYELFEKPAMAWPESPPIKRFAPTGRLWI